MKSDHLFSGDGFGYMGYYYVAEGLALKLIENCKGYRAIREQCKADWVQDVADFCYNVAELLIFAYQEHDRLLRQVDPYGDQESLRYSPKIAEAFEYYYETFDFDNL